MTPSVINRESKPQTAYAVPRHLGPIEIRLDGNEGQVLCPDMLQMIDEIDPSELRIYPSTRELEAFIANLYGLDADQVLVTAGADDGLMRMCRAYLSPTRNLVLPEPTFEMIKRFATWCFAEIRSVSWTATTYPLEAAIDAVNESTSVIAVVTPNNPTGGVISSEALRALSERCPTQMLMVDCAYAEFADEDVTQTALSLPNAVVFRTLSKALGLAGLRVGFAMGPVAAIAKLRASGMPYPVSVLSLKLAEKGLQNRALSNRYVETVRRERTALSELLASYGIATTPSQGNFVLARTSDALWWRDALAGFGIGVRVWPNSERLGDAVRITCPGNTDDFDRLMAALRSLLKPEAILFDIDGVLADVSRSYRAAIMTTASTYGVAVTAEDIDDIKRAGDANNDWAVTQSLLSARGVSVPFEDVKASFESLYWGTPDNVGLCENESFIGDLDRFKRLALRIPLAAVTGRPKRDALMFLERFGVLGCFKAVVTMEDAPIKPNPAPVQEALRQLGVSGAWMVGDTRDDVEAARGAGVLPLGVLAPADDAPEDTRQALLTAGAARVFNQWTEVEEYLG